MGYGEAGDSKISTCGTDISRTEPSRRSRGEYYREGDDIISQMEQHNEGWRDEVGFLYQVSRRVEKLSEYPKFSPNAPSACSVRKWRPFLTTQ